MKVKLFHRLDNRGFITLEQLRFAQLEHHLMRKKSIITGIRYLCGGKLSTRQYDKHDDFDFHVINLPFLSSNIPSIPSYGVYILQLIRYATCCSHYCSYYKILNIATSAWLINFCHKAIQPCDLRSPLRNFVVDIRISLRNTEGQSRKW